MQTISTFVEGSVVKAPVLTAAHLIAFQKIQRGNTPDCSVHILKDLQTIGWIKEVHNGRQN